MALPEREGGVPQRRSARDAFGSALGSHKELVSGVDIFDLPEAKIKDIVSNYLLAGFNYISECEDEYLKTLGENAWEALRSGRVQIWFGKGNKLLDDPDEQGNKEVLYQFPNDTIEFLSISSQNEEKTVTRESAILNVPPGFLLRAKSAPVHALAEVVSVASGIRDFISLRSHLENGSMRYKRRDATISHLLHYFQKEDWTLMYHPAMQQLAEKMEKYPDGIDSLNGGKYPDLRTPSIGFDVTQN